MSNPTELPDLDKQYAEWCERHDLPAHLSREAFDDATTLHLLRAQPEGEAPQASTAPMSADDLMRVVRANWGDMAAIEAAFLANMQGRIAAGTLSPLCGAHHAESEDPIGEFQAEARQQKLEEAVRGWSRHAESGKEAQCTIGVGDGSGRLFVHGDYDSIMAVRSIIIENEYLRAAQQAAAPGALNAEATRAIRRAVRYLEENDCTGPAADLKALLDLPAASSAPGTPEAPSEPAHGHRDDYYLLANGRRLGLEPISRVRNMPNWVLAMELFATGSTSARQLCRDAGVHPDSTITHRAAQLDGGQEGSAT